MMKYYIIIICRRVKYAVRWVGKLRVLLLCLLSFVPRHTGWYGIRPFSVFEAPQHGGALDFQVLVAAESDHVADGVVKLDGGHPASDHRARIRAGLNTCEHEEI